MNTTRNAKRFVNNIRKKTGKNLPKPIAYIGGGVNGKVYLTNSGKLMKIGIGSNPQEFRPLHVLKNTGFVPKFNQKNWMIVPIAKRSHGSLKYLNSAKKLFPKKLNNIKRTNNRNIYKSFLKNKKATIFLMNKIGNSGNTIMTLDRYLRSSTWLTNISKKIIRNEVRNIVENIHKKGISHGNLHSGNILVSITPGKPGIKLWMIDFGRSTVIPLNMTERNAYAKKFKPSGMFRSTGLLSKPGYNNVPLYYNKLSIPRRLNAHMLQVHYGINNYPRNVKSTL